MYKISTWHEVSDKVYAVNPALADIINKIDPPSSFKLLEASYPFGKLIVDKGKSCLFNIESDIDADKNSVENIKKLIANHFSYSPIPLAMIMHNLVEVFVETSQSAIPLNIIKNGDMFGVFETMDYLMNLSNDPIWSVSAGARNLFTLPKIADANGTKRLKMEFNITSPIEIRNIQNHWDLFKIIANNKNKSHSWECKIIYFSDQWFNLKRDPAWFDFYDYICKKSWNQSRYAISRLRFSLMWQKFIETISERGLKPRPYLSDTVKHVFSMASGLNIGMGPCDNHQQAAPTQYIQEALIHIYQLKHYYPTIMTTQKFIENEKSFPIYYSLSYPILLEGSPVDRYSSTIMLDLRDIKNLIDVYQSTLTDSNNNLLTKEKFQYFHVEKDQYNEIIPSENVYLHDDRFHLDSDYQDLKFCSNSAFWRGCVKINPN